MSAGIEGLGAMNRGAVLGGSTVIVITSRFIVMGSRG